MRRTDIIGKVEGLTAKDLRHVCDPGRFSFTNTGELSPLDGVIGQERAVRAVSFGIDSPGYHMYALGPVGTICSEEQFLHFDPTGVEKVIEQSARMVAYQDKLATRFGDIVDLIPQASYWAGTNVLD